MKKPFIINVPALIVLAILLPKTSLCIDFDSITEEKPFNISDCLKLDPVRRQLDKNCMNLDVEAGNSLSITKEDLFDLIKTDIRNADNPNVDDLSFASRTVNMELDMPEYVIKGKSYYARDIFVSIVANSYGLKGNGEGFGPFTRLTKQLATFYEEKRKDPKATPDEIIDTLRAWKTGEEYSYFRRENPEAAKVLLAFAKDYDKFLESIVPEYAQKKESYENNIKKLVAKQEAEKKQNEENERLAEAKKIKYLLSKWANFGIPREMLESMVRTYAGITASGDLVTLVEIIDKIPGLQKCNKNGEVWLCSQKRKDDITGKSHNIKYAFYDLRKTKGYVWLERVIINGKDFPSDQLLYLVINLLQGSK